MNGEPVDLYVLNDGVMTLEDLTGYQVLTYFQGRGSTHQSYFTDTLTLDSVYREGYIVIQITLPSGAYLPKNSTFDLSLNYDISTVSSVSARAVFYGPNSVIAGDAPTVDIDTSTNIIQINEAQNNKSQLSVIEIWLTLGGMEWSEIPPQPGTFTVSGMGDNVYYYDANMIWSEWISSDYNTQGARIYDNKILWGTTSQSNQFLIYSFDSFVLPSDSVQSINYQIQSRIKNIEPSGVSYSFDFSIKSINISTLDDNEIQGGILAWIKSIFNSIMNLPQNIADKIKSFFDMLGDKITDLGNVLLDGIKGLFIPSEESITDLKEDFEEVLADRFGAVYESAEVIDNFASAFFNQGQVVSAAEHSGIIHFPEVTVDLVDTPFTFGGWDVDIIPDQFDSIISLLKIAIDIVCTFAFVNALRKKLEVVLK